jgi:DNA-binding MarR family transcriptional regulator
MASASANEDPEGGAGSEMMKAFAVWGDSLAAREGSFHGYVEAIAHARFVLRKVLRILDEQAREHGLEPLQHQVLLQVYGSGDGIAVSKIAERLDIAAAFTSRLVRQLEELGLVWRAPHKTDKRVVLVTATRDGIERLRLIDRSIYRHIRFFQDELTEEGKLGALGIFAFYVGLDGDSTLAAHLRRSVQEAKKMPNGD